MITKILYGNGALLYEGETLDGCPYGYGTVFWPNGNKYQEGKFGYKGLLEGQEYYQNGFLRFDGKWEKNKGYGPNIPKEGSFYSPDGEILFTGAVKSKRSGLGYPSVVEPSEYGAVVQPNCPHYDRLLYDPDRSEYLRETNG